MSDLEELQKLVVDFRDKRNWKKHHNPKDLAISLVLEASELLEHFQWRSKEEFEKYLRANKDDVADELADVLYWVLLIANDLEIDIPDHFKRKLEKNEKKYPVETANVKYSKHSELNK